MARIFLDSNFVIETVGLRKSEIESENLGSHEVFISPLTIHIVCYAFKRRIPDEIISGFVNQVHVVDLARRLVELALSGPTDDFEDNIQLHSATVADADYFLTHDQELLEIGYFGKTKIVDSLEI